MLARRRVAEHGQQCVDHARIELRARVRAKLALRFYTQKSLAIRTVGRHRAPGIAGADDPCREWDRLAGETVRIPRAVPALVAGTHDLPDLPEQPADLVEHLLTDDRVRVHQRAFGVVERPRLVDDLRGDLDLADVVQQRRELRTLPVARLEPEAVGDGDDEIDDLAAVV